MADYIYLLQNRLAPAQWRAMEAVREAARAQGMPVFLVGGAVRDLTSGSPVRDLDFALQGDVERLIEALEASGARTTGRNQVLSSVFLTFRGGARAEISPTLTVSYPKPGQPVAHPAAILDDLRRRDFTANAMAVSLNEGSYGLLLDPLNGTADIENREFRLVSPYGFIENPALLLRAARLSNRLGWSLEERTEARYRTSKEEDHLAALAAADRGYELEELFHEEDPISALEHMAAEGWLAQLSPSLKVENVDRSGIEAVRDAVGQLEGQGISPDPSALYFPLLTGKLQEKERSALKGAFARPGFGKQIDTLEELARDLGSQLASKAAAQPSDAWRLLRAAEPDLVLWLAVHARSGAVQTKIKSFLKDWPQMRQKLPYALMHEMRITPELPAYEKLLDDLFFALIDGKLETPEATRAFLEPYSPPAPLQVAVRRRPAKAAKGRGKRAAAKEETADETEVLDEAVVPESEPDEDMLEDSSNGELDVSASASDEPMRDGDEDGAEEPGVNPESEPVRASEPEQAAEAATAFAPVPPKTPKVTIPKQQAKKTAVSPAVPVPPVKKVAASKQMATQQAAKKQAAERTVSAERSSAARPEAKSAQAGGSGAKKTAVKTATVKAVAKTTPKPSGKVAAKKVVAKAAVKPTAAKKNVAAKGKKVPAKKQAQKNVKAQQGTVGRGGSPAKGSKAVKKVPAKSRGKR